MSQINIKKFIIKSGWLVAMAVLMDFIAFDFWSSYLSEGSVHDGKHGITFIGAAASGHLAFATMGALVFTFFAIKSILELYREY